MPTHVRDDIKLKSQESIGDARNNIKRYFKNLDNTTVSDLNINKSLLKITAGLLGNSRLVTPHIVTPLFAFQKSSKNYSTLETQRR